MSLDSLCGVFVVDKIGIFFETLIDPLVRTELQDIIFLTVMPD